jgi:hypothetical protein
MHRRGDRSALVVAKKEASAQRKRTLPLTRIGLGAPSSLEERLRDYGNFRDLSDCVRHLTYHMYPVQAANESWNWNLDQLQKRWGLFDGKKVLGVNVGENTASVAEILEACHNRGMVWDHVIERPNDPVLGEVMTWIPSLELLNPDFAKPNEVVFSAHAKGVKYGDCPPVIRNWTDCMYRANLDSWFLVKQQLQWFVSTGAFKGRWAGSSAYSGAFWWWRLHDIGKKNWRHVRQYYPGREVWISNHARHEEMGCLIGDNCRDMYSESYWQHRVWPEWRRFAATLTPDRNRIHKPIAYLISSHFSYAPMALPRLLDSMIASGVKPEQIFVVMCGCRREFDQRTTRGTFWYVNHESRNFCAFVEAVDERRREALQDFDHVFCLLDTSEVGPKFAAVTDDFDREWDAVGVNPHGGEDRAQCDLAAYSLDHLRSIRHHIETFRNAHSSVNWEWEGKVFGLAQRKWFYGREKWGPIARTRTSYEHIGKQVVAGPLDVYGTGSMRITEYYKYADMFRFKSNWGQNPFLLDRV